MVWMAGEDESVIDIDEDVYGFREFCAIEEAVVKGAHGVALGKEGGAVVLIEDAARVRESVEGVGDAIFLCGVEIACEGDVRLQCGDNPVAVRWERGVKIRGLDVHGCHSVSVDDG